MRKNVPWQADLIIQVIEEWDVFKSPPARTGRLKVRFDCSDKFAILCDDHAAALAVVEQRRAGIGAVVVEDFTVNALEYPKPERFGGTEMARSIRRIDYLNGAPGRANPKWIDGDGLGHGWTWNAFPEASPVDYGFVGDNYITQPPWFDDHLAGLGITPTIREVPNVATMGGPVRELVYEHVGGHRYAYVLVLQGADDFAQEVFVFQERVPDSLLPDLVQALRQRAKTS